MATNDNGRVASDTDESEASSFSGEEREGGEEDPLIAAVSDSEGSEKQSSMNDIDGDSEEEDEEGEERGEDDDEEEGEDDDDEPIEDEFTNATPLECLSDKPLDDDDWKEVCLARICMFGNKETCVQAVVMQTKDGAESGSADKSISRNDMSKEKIKEGYVLVDQPMGYVTRVTGYHSKPGKPCLLHSIKIQFASGQVIELQGETESYKGEAFVVQNLADNFYLATIDFEEGKCIGYSGYSTDTPLAEMMEEESLPDEDMLNEALEDNSEDHEGGDGMGSSSKGKNKKNKNRGTGDSAPINPPTGGDDGSWVSDSLPAIELPMPPPEEEKSWRISHVCLSGAPCVRSCIFHYYDGDRFGYLLKEDLAPVSCSDHEQILDANGDFMEIDQPGGYITKISGYHMGEGGCPKYLCHSLQLEFQSGQVLTFQGHSDAEVWRGKYFSYTPPDDFYIHQLKFDGEGQLSSVVGIRTEEMDFPPMEMPEIEEGKKKCCGCF